LTDDEYKARRATIIAECGNKHLTESSPEVAEALNSLEGGAYLIWLGLRRNHEKITYQDVLDNLTIETTKTASDTLGLISGLSQKKVEVAVETST
jgi:threonine/homoserine/homoserine lactone efflux protein